MVFSCLNLFLFIFRRDEGCATHNRVTPKLLGLLPQRPGAKGFHMLKEIELKEDALGPTLLNLQDWTVRRHTERTMLLQK
jgi:hypothetical protein